MTSVERAAGPRTPAHPHAGLTILALSLLLPAVGLVITVGSGQATVSEEAWWRTLYATYGCAGALVVALRPRLVVGWLLAASAVLAGIGGLTQPYAYVALVQRPGTLPLGDVAGLLGSTVWYPAIGLPMTLLLLRSRTGGCPRPAGVPCPSGRGWSSPSSSRGRRSPLVPTRGCPGCRRTPSLWGAGSARSSPGWRVPPTSDSR